MTKEEREPFESKARSEKERAKSQAIAVTSPSYGQRDYNFGRMLSQESIHMDDESGRADYCEKLIESCVRVWR